MNVRINWIYFGDCFSKFFIVFHVSYSFSWFFLLFSGSKAFCPGECSDKLDLLSELDPGLSGCNCGQIQTMSAMLRIKLQSPIYNVNI